MIQRTDKPLRILLADYVPLNNKGEQAIIYGIQDMLGGSQNVEISMFGPDYENNRPDKLTVFPQEWIFATRLSPNKYHRLFTALQLRLGIFGRLNRLVQGGDPMFQEVRQAFDLADIILVGHDGFFCLENAAILNLAKRAAKRRGILGSGFFLPARRSLVDPIYRGAVTDSDFCYFREKTAWNYMRALAPSSDKPRLGPDPAFAMLPAPVSAVEALLGKWAWYANAVAQRRPIVVVTVCEKSVIYRCSFLSETNPERKREAHAAFVAELLDTLVAQRNAQIVFLPHSIETGDGNDVAVARTIAKAMRSNPDARVILDEDLSARMLKGIIGKADFCVGERTHSLIGSFSVATPFLGLTNTADIRTHEILGAMGRCEEQLYDMDNPVAQQAVKLLLGSFDRRAELRQQIARTFAEFEIQLKAMARVVKGEEP